MDMRQLMGRKFSEVGLLQCYPHFVIINQLFIEWLSYSGLLFPFFRLIHPHLCNITLFDVTASLLFSSLESL